MANTLLSPNTIAMEAQMVLHNNSVMLPVINRQYDPSFARDGAKIGYTLNLRLPNRAIVNKGAAMNIGDISETSTPLTVNTQAHVDFTFSNSDLTMVVDEFSDRYLKPFMGKLAAQVDADVLALAASRVYNQVGTAGITPGMTGGTVGEFSDSSAPAIFLSAGNMLDNFAVPTQDRYLVLNPKGQALSIKGLSGLFNDQETISSQFKYGRMGHALNFDFAMSQNVFRQAIGTHAAASLAAVQVYGANQTGTSLNLKGFTASQTGVLKAGEVIRLVGVYSLNPENQKSTGELQQFVIQSDANSDASGYATVSIQPPITVASPTLATATVTNSPADSAQCYLDSLPQVGVAANTTLPINVAFHKDAFILGTADLILPNGVHFAAREHYEGVSMNIISQFNISDYTMPTRIDVLYGATCLPDRCVRIAG